MGLLKTLLTKGSRELSIGVRSKYSVLPTLVTRKRAYTTAITKQNEVFSAGLEVKVTSREMIKPSTPTPRHLNTVYLSLLDQCAATFYIPFVLFYKNDVSNDTIDELKLSGTLLKRSLSETLVRYYPLSGRIQGHESIKCEDEGVEFCEAYVSQNLMDVIERPNLDELQALLPFKGSVPIHQNIMLSIQLNHFLCGGTAIGLRLSHKIADGSSMAAFLNDWAATTRAQREGHTSIDSECPIFNGASILPPMIELNASVSHEGYHPKLDSETISSKQVVFDKEMIDQLKSKVGLDVPTLKPTRVEVVTAFIWKQLMIADQTTTLNSVRHAVNFRTKIVPPIPESVFGNFTCPTRTTRLLNGHETNFPELVYNIRKSINKINNNYLTPLFKGDQRWDEIMKEKDNFMHGEDSCFFTSLCSFQFNKINFGLGGPVWTCMTSVPINNTVVLTNTKCGRGVEAWVHMRPHVIKALDFGRSIEF